MVNKTKYDSPIAEILTMSLEASSAAAVQTPMV